ncbi:MAG: imidazolonepropionase [Acidimicrobiales bacterium]|nr:imidazolonepropionase [Acidimicrobiales bacterium]MDG1877689.1 imidazolonepropionase [Acidimicrobiales bacterium]
MTTTVIDHIGLLITNDSALGEGPLGQRRNASVVIEDDRVVSVGDAGQIADKRIDAEGACVLPGFVDSHTHLVFAGDRSEEFTARMSGQPYDGGGIRVTTEATRSTSTAELDRLVRLRLAEAHRAGTTTIEIKSGYGLNVEDEARSLDIARRHTSETTFLGAHLVPSEYVGNEDDYVDLVCGDMLAASAPYAKWIDAFCESGAFDAEQSRAVLEAGAAVGLTGRLHGNQLGPGPGVQLAVECGCASVDHCTYLTDADINALADSNTVATFLPAADFSTKQPYADARRVLDAGVTVALASNCNPGSSYTTSISFCIAIAVRDMGMTIDEAIQAVTLGGAAALRRDDIGRLTPGSAGHAVILDAPSHHHLAYRPGVPLIRDTIGPLGH